MRERPTPPYPDLHRCPTASFGWLDARLLHERWLASLGPSATAVLALLALAADSQGVSYWSRVRMTQALRLPRRELIPPSTSSSSGALSPSAPGGPVTRMASGSSCRFPTGQHSILTLPAKATPRPASATSSAVSASSRPEDRPCYRSCAPRSRKSAHSRSRQHALQLEPLFDGETLEGWVSYATEEAPTGWVVEDGALARKEGGCDLRTLQSYDNFELRLDWKISPKGNSGIMYRVKAQDGEPYYSGPEYQILDDQGQGLDDQSRESSAALYALVAAEGKELHSAGEYNKARIVVQGNHVEHWLNGKRVVEIEMHSQR